MGKAALAPKQKKDNEKTKAPLNKVKKANLKDPRPRKKSVKLADKDVRVKISTGELQQVGLNKSKCLAMIMSSSSASVDGWILQIF